MSKEIAGELCLFAEKMYGKDKLRIDRFSNSERIELTIESGNSVTPYISLLLDENITLQLGNLGNDDYVFEYDDYSYKNVGEVKNWLHAVTKHRLKEVRKRFLRFTYSRKLVDEITAKA